MGDFNSVSNISNIDHIRGMSDVEFVNWISEEFCDQCSCCIYLRPCRLEFDVEFGNETQKYDCKQGIATWLNQSYEGE